MNANQCIDYVWAPTVPNHNSYLAWQTDILAYGWTQKLISITNNLPTFVFASLTHPLVKQVKVI